ncbi:MAG: hypothetical protein HKN21_09175 [Candidatus Eisenbacteria bacterium]|uniref:Uncharacterized protein n=1 Tax=Eiseniibacteriota bacterium TaxID=2212470 RepID=A0A7Y2E830_UNCEI|nr:hypothetical protein [Candidatus Eisenbacteria bacterium]
MKKQWTRHGVVAVLAMGLMGSMYGCSEEDNGAAGLAGPDGTTIAAVAVPTLAEIQSAVDLETVQVPPMENNLGHWRERNGRQNLEEPAPITFLRESGSVLSSDQMVLLINTVADRYDAAISSRVENGEGRPGFRGRGRGNRSGQGQGQFQRGGGNGKRGGLFSELDLSEEQQEAMKALREAQRNEQGESIHAQLKAGTISAEQARDLMKEKRLAREAALAEILDADQLAKLEELHRAKEIERATKKLENTGDFMDKKLGVLTDILQLTESQVSSASAIMETAKTATQAMLNTIIESGLPKEEAFYQGYQIRTEAKAALEGILTEDQLEVFATLQERMPKKRGGKGGRGR